MKYDLAKELEEAGFPQKTLWAYYRDKEVFIALQRDYKEHFATAEFICARPTLSELIEACGRGFSSLTRSPRDTWYVATPKANDAYELMVGGEYDTPEEAVGRLWLALNQH